MILAGVIALHDTKLFEGRHGPGFKFHKDTYFAGTQMLWTVALPNAATSFDKPFWGIINHFHWLLYTYSRAPCFILINHQSNCIEATPYFKGHIYNAVPGTFWLLVLGCICSIIYFHFRWCIFLIWHNHALLFHIICLYMIQSVETLKISLESYFQRHRPIFSKYYSHFPMRFKSIYH